MRRRIPELATAAAMAVLLALLFTPLNAQSRCPGGAVTVTTANWAAVLAANGPGTTYCFADGTYNNFSVTPEDGDQFYAASLQGAVLNGQGVERIAFNGINDVGDNTPALLAVQVVNVRVDGFKLIRYVNNEVWQGCCPNQGALTAYTGWVILNNLFEGTPSQPMSAAITIAKANWGCARNVLIQDNTIRGMTHLAILGNMIDGDIVGNVIQNNGWGAPSFAGGTASSNNDYGSIEWNGQFKITNNRVASWTAGGGYACSIGAGEYPYVAYNVVERNRGEAVWADVSVTRLIAEHNIVRGNSGGGLQSEISTGTLFRYNTVYCNNWEWNGETWRKGEIVNWNTTDFTAHNNYVRVCGPGDQYEAMGTTFTYAPRAGSLGVVGGTGFVFTDAGRQALSANVYANIVVLSPGAWRAAIFERYTANAMPVTFANNVYYVAALGASRYEDLAGLSGFAGWQAKGRDTSGSETTAAPPAPPIGGRVTTPTPGGPTATPAPTASATATQPASGCYLAACAAVPGRVEMEHFDYGPSGSAYRDASPGNYFGTYRIETDVDVKAIDGGHSIGFGEAGDWTQYTLSVASSGYYDIVLRLATADTGASATATLGLSIDGAALPGSPLAVPRVQTWGDFGTAALTSVYIASGTRVLRVTVNTTFVDIDYVEFTLVSGVTAAPTLTRTPSATATASATPTASSTPAPPTARPSLTPTATRVLPTGVQDALATQSAANAARATAGADVLAQLNAIATESAALSDLIATRSAAQSTQEAADRQVDIIIATP